jgi:hypothetical protein
MTQPLRVFGMLLLLALAAGAAVAETSTVVLAVDGMT